MAPPSWLNVETRLPLVAAAAVPRAQPPGPRRLSRRQPAELLKDFPSLDERSAPGAGCARQPGPVVRPATAGNGGVCRDRPCWHAVCLTSSQAAAVQQAPRPQRAGTHVINERKRDKAMGRALKTLTVLAAILSVLGGCRAMTGKTAGEVVDDANI